MKKRVRRPSPSILIACLALFLALGGGVYAAAKSSKISGSKIKKSSIAGNRLKKDTLTGKQIKESTLGTVPSASVAADVAGQTRFNFKLGFGQTQTILTAGPFTFTGFRSSPTSSSLHVLEPSGSLASSGMLLKSLFTQRQVSTAVFPAACVDVTPQYLKELAQMVRGP